MGYKSALILILITLLVTPIISAKIIWSEPVTIGFTVGPAPQLEIIITSPEQGREYNTNQINLEFSTNIYATCTYKIDNQDSVSLESGINFSKKLDIEDGEHTITISCTSGEQKKTKSVSFSIDTEKEPRKKSSGRPRIIEPKMFCGEWKCIKNRLTRTCYLGDEKITKTGQICGLVLDADEKPTEEERPNIIYLPLIFLILIIIIMVLLIYAVMKR